MNNPTPTEILAQVANAHRPEWDPTDEPVGIPVGCSCGRAEEPYGEHLKHVAEMQAAALAKAAEGTITISTEGLPGRAELLARADEYLPGSTVRNVLIRVAEALPDPVVVSLLAFRPGDRAQILFRDDTWRTAILTPGFVWLDEETTQQVNACNGFAWRPVRHDAGAGQ